MLVVLGLILTLSGVDTTWKTVSVEIQSAQCYTIRVIEIKQVEFSLSCDLHLYILFDHLTWVYKWMVKT